MKERSTITGVALAAAAASLFITGCASQGSDAQMQMADSSAVKVHCYGANACKGQAECKTSMNGCKGQNACKGQGFVSMTEKSCLDHFART